jgi:phosphatidylinositol alpha-mannosyltransferase
MKIVQVCPYDIDRPGGVQRHIRDTAAALCERGHQVTIIAPAAGTPPVPPPPGVVIRRLGRAWRIGFSGTRFELSLALGRDRATLRRLMQDFDLAHFHTVWTPLLTLQALAAWRGPAVATFHDTPPRDFGGRLLQRLFRLLSRILLPRFEAVLVPSVAPKGHLIAGRGQAVTVFPPCTDLRPFSTASPQPGLADGRLNILFLGRLERRKGVLLLLEAFRSLQGKNLRLIIAGAGPQEAALKVFAKRHGLTEVVFAGAPSETAPWFAACDIFCAPSPFGESFGIVIAEAMAAGKPVVAAANAGYRTLLTGEAARFLVPPGDAAALAGALAMLAADRELRHRLGEWGRGSASAYDCRALAPRLEEIFRDAIVAHRVKARSAT